MPSIPSEDVRASLRQGEKSELYRQLAKPLVMQCYLDSHRKALTTIHYSSTDNTGTKNCSKLSSKYSQSQRQQEEGDAPLPPPPLTREEEEAEDLHSEWKAVAKVLP